MKKLVLSSLVTASVLSLTACCDRTKPQATEPAKTATADTTASNVAAAGAGTVAAAASTLALGDFDWSGINKSSVDLGSFPYFNLPEGMKLLLADGAAADGSTDGTTDGKATKTWEDGAINIYDGKQIFNTDGKLNYLDIVMAADGGEFDKDKFDQHVTDYMNKIGAVEFFDDKVPAEAAEQLKTLDGMNHQDYMAGDFADRTLRQFAVNHDNGQLFYQVMSDGSHGEIGIIETKGFLAAADTQPVTVEPAEPAPITVIEDPTADEMMNQLDSSGKAILNIHFDTAKSSIRADDQSIIEQIYALMSEHPEINLSVEGHTDDQGEAEMNQSLSQSRAEQVKAVLVDKGIDAARLKAVGHGESKPIAANDTAENKAKNRRVELVRF